MFFLEPWYPLIDIKMRNIRVYITLTQPDLTIVQANEMDRITRHY